MATSDPVKIATANIKGGLSVAFLMAEHGELFRLKVNALF